MDQYFYFLASTTSSTKSASSSPNILTLSSSGAMTSRACSSIWGSPSIGNYLCCIVLLESSGRWSLLLKKDRSRTSSSFQIELSLLQQSIRTSLRKSTASGNCFFIKIDQNTYLTVKFFSSWCCFPSIKQASPSTTTKRYSISLSKSKGGSSPTKTRPFPSSPAKPKTALSTISTFSFARSIRKDSL